MRTSFLHFLSCFKVFSGVFLRSGCLKDYRTHSRGYKVFSPVCSSLNTIRNAFRAETLRPILETIFGYQTRLFVGTSTGVLIYDFSHPVLLSKVNISSQ